MHQYFYRHKFFVFLLPFIGGLFYASGFPGDIVPNFFLAPLVGIILLFLFIDFNFNSKKSENSLIGQLAALLSFSFGYYLLGYYWIPETIQTFGSIPFPFNHALGALFSIFILPHFIVFIVGHWIYQKLSVRSSFLVASLPKKVLVYALILTLFEYFTPQQFPAHLGHPWLQLAPNLGLAPLFGSPAFSFVTYLMALSITAYLKTGLKDIFAPAIFVIFLAANLFVPLSWKEASSDSKQSINVRMVQANIGNYVKVSSEKGHTVAFKEVTNNYKSLSSRPANEDIDLIIWPETAYPSLLSSQFMKSNTAFIPQAVRDSILSHDASIIFGGYDRSQNNNTYAFETEYNSVFFIDENLDLKDTYHKIKLIPFGEKLPFGFLNEYIAPYVQNISYFATGKHHILFKHPQKNYKFISAVCYEILFPTFIRNYLNSVNEKPHFIVNLTNDSWYGDTSEPHQHLFLSKWRALEFQIPLLRITNTGISSAIFPDGSESERLKVFEQNVLDIKLPLIEGDKTLYQKFGIFMTILLVAGIFLTYQTVEWLQGRRRQD